MNVSSWSRKEVGDYGERVVSEYLRRRWFRLVARNVARKTGELDVILRKGKTLHFVEVKTILVLELERERSAKDAYDPSANLHALKIRRVARTAEWYVANKGWKGDWQVDGALVWLRARDGVAKVSYFPQIL